MSRAYPHTVTVWRRDGEDGERRAVWARRVLRGVRWIEARAKSSGIEDSARDEARLLVPRGTGGCGTSWEPRRGDRAMLGASSSPGPEPQALAVESVEPVRRGRAVDHYEATAR